MMERIEEILEEHPAAVYLPCFYRAGPPRIFIQRDSVKILIKEGEGVAFDSMCYEPAGRGYRELGRGTYFLAYEFQPGASFEFEAQGILVEKVLGPDELVDEVKNIRESLGVQGLVPLLEMRMISSRTVKGPVLRIKKLDPGVEPPSYAHEGDAGLDIRSAEELTLEPGERAVVSTGFAMALPEGYAAFVQPRSGLAARSGISIVNTPGLIDCHYRGEVKVILVNLGDEPFQVRRGDRIAQMVVQGVEPADVELVEELDETARGEGGFGSTGI